VVPVKRLWLFCGLAGLLLGSAAPPPSSRSIGTPARTLDLARVEAQPVATPFDAEADAVPAPIDAPAAFPPAQVADPPAAPAATPAAAEDGRTDRGVRVVISLPQQTAYVFKDGRLFATSPVSTGRAGHETPAGSFGILQKKVRHRSSRYGDAPMPYMQRLTWSGIALHAGRVPGYRASHGCIRLPWKFARTLYRITDFSTEVTVTHAQPKTAAAALNAA
jgi:lipoprotein-anchoring transpeptidase ErfK/SrfK